jgi:hypothetical protein
MIITHLSENCHDTAHGSAIAHHILAKIERTFAAVLLVLEAIHLMYNADHAGQYHSYKTS